jgi:ABC-2 type transport system ATP-binding protein
MSARPAVTSGWNRLRRSTSLTSDLLPPVARMCQVATCGQATPKVGHLADRCSRGSRRRLVPNLRGRFDAWSRWQDEEILSLRNVRKTYRRLGAPRVTALDGLDLTVDQGGVHGFLGPNGSGKTTALRVLLGLASADSGSITVFGHNVPDALPAVLGDIGALVDGPRLFPAWSGRVNLRALGKMYDLSDTRVEECLDIVGMRDSAETPFKSCSLGMKQRLGIAAAILREPKLLILDEPANGLDPVGIREIRELIKTIGGATDATVFVSSHQISEVEMICDTVSIIAKGRLVASGSVRDIVGNRADRSDMLLHTSDVAEAYRILTTAGFRCVERPDGLLVRASSDSGSISEVLATGGQFLTAMIPQSHGLEEAFLALTGEHQ